MLLELVALALAGIHFGVPLAYYFYLKRAYLNKPWNVKVDENYRPRVTVIVPTYNEARSADRIALYATGKAQKYLCCDKS